MLPTTLLSVVSIASGSVAPVPITASDDTASDETASDESACDETACDETACDESACDDTNSRALLPAMEEPAAAVVAAPCTSPHVWTKLTTEPYPGKQGDVAFVDVRTGWYVNGAGKIFHTEDGGATWKLVAIAGAPSVGLCALGVVRTPFVNAGTLDTKVRLVSGGRVGGPAVFVHSEALGETWAQTALPEGCAMVLDVHCLDQKVGFLAAATDANVAKSHAAILRTSDGGKTWTQVYASARPFDLTWKIAFPTDDVGFVTIQNYDPDPKSQARFVAKTVDGGSTWTEIPLAEDHAVREFGIGFLDERTGWVGAMPGGFETRDGGATWQRVEFGNAVNKIRIVREENRATAFALGVGLWKLELGT